jgi:chromate transporter
MKVSPLRFLGIWTLIGIQSFGGGSATLYLIRRAAVERYAWITDEDMTRYWGICQIAPGINILGLVVLIGFQVSGAAGAALALTGLLLPSAAITAALTSIYAGIREAPVVQAAIGGVVPATVGLSMLVGFTMLRPLLTSAKREGSSSLGIAVTLLLASTAIAARGGIPVLGILWGAGALYAAAKWLLVR